MIRRRPCSTLFPYTTLFRSMAQRTLAHDKIKPIWNSVVTDIRSEEHTSELQSRRDLVCRLLLEKKNGHVSPSARLPHAYPLLAFGRQPLTDCDADAGDPESP